MYAHHIGSISLENPNKMMNTQKIMVSILLAYSPNCLLCLRALMKQVAMLERPT